MTEMSKTEFSRTVDLAVLRERKRFQDKIEATPAECKALAERYEILAVERVEATVTLRTINPDLFRLQARITAQVVQACSLTGEPVPELIEEDHDELLTTQADSLIPFDEAEPGQEVPTELIVGEKIDYGEVVAQIIVLALNPFPRASDEPFQHIEHSENAFAALAGLKIAKKTNDNKE